MFLVGVVARQTGRVLRVDDRRCGGGKGRRALAGSQHDPAGIGGPDVGVDLDPAGDVERIGHAVLLNVARPPDLEQPLVHSEDVGLGIGIVDRGIAVERRVAGRPVGRVVDVTGILGKIGAFVHRSGCRHAPTDVLQRGCIPVAQFEQRAVAGFNGVVRQKVLLVGVVVQEMMHGFLDVVPAACRGPDPDLVHPAQERYVCVTSDAQCPCPELPVRGAECSRRRNGAVQVEGCVGDVDDERDVVPVGGVEPGPGQFEGVGCPAVGVAFSHDCAQASFRVQGDPELAVFRCGIGAGYGVARKDGLVVSVVRMPSVNPAFNRQVGRQGGEVGDGRDSAGMEEAQGGRADRRCNLHADGPCARSAVEHGIGVEDRANGLEPDIVIGLETHERVAGRSGAELARGREHSVAGRFLEIHQVWPQRLRDQDIGAQVAVRSAHIQGGVDRPVGRVPVHFVGPERAQGVGFFPVDLNLPRRHHRATRREDPAVLRTVAVLPAVLVDGGRRFQTLRHAGLQAIGVVRRLARQQPFADVCGQGFHVGLADLDHDDAARDLFLHVGCLEVLHDHEALERIRGRVSRRGVQVSGRVPVQPAHDVGARARAA